MEAYDSAKREIELKEINQFITRETIVVGDFNMIDPSDYEEDFKTKYINNPLYKKFKDSAAGIDVINNFKDKQSL